MSSLNWNIFSKFFSLSVYLSSGTPLPSMSMSDVILNLIGFFCVDQMSTLRSLQVCYEELKVRSIEEILFGDTFHDVLGSDEINFE